VDALRVLVDGAPLGESVAAVRRQAS
jgi:hypothetical protein